MLSSSFSKNKPKQLKKLLCIAFNKLYLFFPKTSVIRVFDSYVNISRHQLGKVLCFDEFYAKKLTKTKYCFGIYDFLSKEVIDILDARRKNVLEDYFYHIPVSERLNVEYVNIDMWDTYAKISYQFFPKAMICIDSLCKVLHNYILYIRLIPRNKTIKLPF